MALCAPELNSHEAGGFYVTTQNNAFDRTRINLTLEASIHIGLAVVLATACLLILRPFVPLLTWGIIIAVSAYPSYRRLQTKLAGRGVLAAGIFTLVLLTLLIVPVVVAIPSPRTEHRWLASRDESRKVPAIGAHSEENQG
jgi:hypothetical protein